MKKLFAMLALMGVLTLGSVPVMAQEEAPAETAVVEEGGIHKELKTKFIEGDAGFMNTTFFNNSSFSWSFFLSHYRY